MPREILWNYRQPERMRWHVGVGVLLTALVLIIITGAFLSSFVWPTTDLGDPTALIRAGRVTDFAKEEPVFFPEARFWLVRQPDDSFVAFSAKDSYRGCTVAWRPDFGFEDPRDGMWKTGWFRDPCHGSVYDPDGTKVFGPSPRDLDRYPVEVIGQEVVVRAGESDGIPGTPSPSLQPFGPGGG